ncbi:DUF397 domain-containing protein [Streptomyces sp. 6N223]|uniref:DUF397 domain-containing protein n=1 Tax=Streptomyces sp. 6N223 TaxID=3457412 RepID=UPI003FD57EC6
MAMVHGETRNLTDWTKSSYSGGNGACVEVRSEASRERLAVRDSKVTGGPRLGFDAGSWSAFLGLVDACRDAAA